MSNNDLEKTLLILDIDETLVLAKESELNREADFVVFNYHVYKRPYLDEFIQEIKDHFRIAVWSSAFDDYVLEIANQIFTKEIELEFVWGRSRCTYKRNLQIDEYGYYQDDYSNHYHYIKPLKKLKRKGFNLERILIIDDSPHKSKDNFGNAIYPSEFKGDIKDDELSFLAKYLITLKNKINVRNIEKRNWKLKMMNKINNPSDQ